MNAKEKISRVIADWSFNDTILLSVWCLIDKKEDKSVKTIRIAATSHPPCLKYNPEWIESLSDQQTEYVLVSECFKILLSHCTTRLKDPKELANLASMITVNDLLEKNTNFNEMDRSIIPTPEKFGLEKGKYFEKYFQDLLDNSEQISSQGMSGAGNGENKDGKGDGDGKKGFEQYFDPNNGATDEWGQNKEMEYDVKEMVNENKSNLRNWGKHTGKCIENIIAANTPKISAKEIIRKFNHSVMSEQLISSRMKINRRYDLDSPGYRHEYKPKILFALDESGSMSNADIAEGFAVINSICKQADITWMSFDTEIKQIEKDYKKAKKTFKTQGRGGTDPVCVLEYAKKEKQDGIVIFSDMEFSENVAKPKKQKVLWLGCHKSCKVPISWGFKAFLNR